MTQQEAPVKVVGSSVFGLYPKISDEKTVNLFISDEWLVSFAGYRKINDLGNDEGRALFHSIRGNFLIAVVGSKIYKINTGGGAAQIGTLATSTGEVFIDENLASQICIVDGLNTYIYSYITEVVTIQTLTVPFDSGTIDLVAGYVEYHNSYFLIAPSDSEPNDTNTWYAFQYATDNTISFVPNSDFPLQTKPDKCLAVQRLPGRANHVLVIGSSVCEVWVNVGGTENYRRNSSFNIDSGAVSRSSIASNDKFVCFLAQNENNEINIMWTDGSQVQTISTDGIDGLLQRINRPDLSTAFFYKQNGHLFYQLTFYDPSDNLTLTYDFKTGKFFHLTDNRLNYHPARQVSYFQGRTLFISLQQGALYEWSTNILDAIDEVGALSGDTIPRIRVCNTIRIGGSQRFYVRKFSFWIDQGLNQFAGIEDNQEVCFGVMLTEDGVEMETEGGEKMLTEDGYCVVSANRPKVALAISRNGAHNFSNWFEIPMKSYGEYKNKVEKFQLGIANEFTIQIRFDGLQRFVANNGVLLIEQGEQY